ncbi:uncharacterized protein LOC115800067 [Archocentrus centrarchus]|uniref:uncharacterized protein LOC115800067 n=1 Tax=Archocentrus centrarchus TaxID=63155 RepID=UPI0011EA3A8F|nr:uncharacterized protein LOC115800067 [Archocentrus centrarchus]
MERSAIPPNTPKLSAEEDALAPQVLEILSGINPEAFETLKEPEDRDVWSLEEGDDSVFYSDEEQDQLDIKSTVSAGNKCRHLANTLSDEPNQQKEYKAGEEANPAKENLDIEREITQLITWTQEEPQKLHTDKAKQMRGLDPGEPGADSQPRPGQFVRTCEDFLQSHCTTAEMQTQPEQNVLAEQANRQVKEEEVELQAQTPDLKSFDVPNEEGYTRLKREIKYPGQLSGAEFQKSSAGQLQADQKTEQVQKYNVQVGLHQNRSPGYSSLPLVKKSGCSESHQDSFNHLTSSKYSTVSYRRIRRGNTRQKIDEFEYMIINQ